MKRYIDIVTRRDVRVFEDQLASISDADLRRLGISRGDLHSVFAEGKRLMIEHGHAPGGGIKAIAEKDGDHWYACLDVDHRPDR